MKKTTLTVAMITAVSGASIISTACTAKGSASTTTKPSEQLVECYGVGKTDAPVVMSKAMCDQLPSTQQVVVDSNDFVHCYGVAAAGKNDCATASVSCGGKVKIDRAPDAWISLPKGICENLKGSSITGPQA